MSEPVKHGVNITSRILSVMLLAMFAWVSLGLMRSNITAQFNERERQQVRDMQQSADISSITARVATLERIAEVNREKIASLQQSMSNYAGIGTGISLTLMVLQALPLILKGRARE